MKRKWRRNRLFALLLSFVLFLGMTPVTVAFAESDNSSGSEAMTESSEKKQGDASGDASSEEEKPADTRQEESDLEQEKTADVSQIKEEQSLSLVLGAGGSNAETGQAYEGSVNWEDLKVGDIIKAGTYTWNGHLVYDDGMKIYLVQTRRSSWSGSQDRIVTSFGQYNGYNVVILERLSNSSSYAVVRGEALTYNGQEQVLTKVGSVVGGTLYYSKDGGSTYTSTEAPKAKEVGTYTVWCKVIGDSSHDDSKPYCVTASINKEDGSASVSLDGWTYGQKANTPVPESSTNGTDHVTYSYSGTTNAGKTYGPSAEAPTEAGNYKVTATFAETEYYNSCTAMQDFTIARADASLTIAPESTEKKYGDEDFILQASKKGDGELSYESSNPNVATVDNSGKVTILGAGEAKITVSVSETANYKGESKEIALSVSKIAGSASVSLEGWTYGQTANTPVSESSTNGTENVSYSYSGTTNAGENYGPSAEAPTEAGSYKVTATFAETDNYNSCSAETDFSIARADAELSVSPESVEKNYGDEEFVLTVSKVSDAVVSYESSSPNVATVDNSGKVTILGAGEAIITVSLPQTDNYEADGKSITVNAAKAEGAGSVSINGWTCGQKANAPIAVSNTNGIENVTYSYSGTTKAGKAYGPSATAPTEAGNYKVTATFAETDNYKACTAYASFTIAEAKKESSLKPTDNNGSKTNNVSNINSKLSGSGVSSNTAAKTGDERDLSLWLALMALCSAGLFEVVFICRKNMRKN